MYYLVEQDYATTCSMAGTAETVVQQGRLVTLTPLLLDLQPHVQMLLQLPVGFFQFTKEEQQHCVI